MSQKLLLLVVPLMCIGASSCSVMKRGQAAYDGWREKRDQRRAEQQLAKAEKEAGLSGEASVADAQAPAVFLDYDNPNALTAEGMRAAGNRGAGLRVSGEMGADELPGSVGELTNAGSGFGDWAGTPFFHAGEGAAAGEQAALHPEIVRAWAGSIAQVTGASLAEPLITAAMTASAGGGATGGDSGEPISLRRSTAAAFAGQESVGLKTSEHEADWSSRQ